MLRNTHITITDDPLQLAEQAARLFTQTALERVRRSGRFAAALSGGTTPRPTHRLFAKEPYLSDIPWDHTHLFWTDERCVPETDPASNYGNAKKDFLDLVPIPADHVHPIPGELRPDIGALQYQKELLAFFGTVPGVPPAFDLIFLGLGMDGHTASLFPEKSSLDENKWLILSVKGGDPDVDRITMTLRILNNATRIVFLVAGKEKATAIKTVIEDEDRSLPAHRVRPSNGHVTWLLDRQAAALLSPEVSHE